MMKQNQKVFVSGEVKWGDSYYRISTNGTINEWKKGSYALVTLEEVNNDRGVCINVKKQYISKLN